MTSKRIYVAQHTSSYEKPFADVVKKLNHTKGPLGKAWTYQVVRPTKTGYDLG